MQNIYKFNSEKYNNITNNEVSKQKSIFDYYTDNTKYHNKNNYIDEKNITLENEIKGINRKNSHCTNEKYTPNLYTQT